MSMHDPAALRDPRRFRIALKCLPIRTMRDTNAGKYEKAAHEGWWSAFGFGRDWVGTNEAYGRVKDIGLGVRVAHDHVQ